MIELTVAGDGLARGLAHGQEFGELVRERIRRFAARDEEGERVVRRLWQWFADAVPDYADEVRGIARGASSELYDVFALTAGAEVFHHTSPWIEGCTNIAALRHGGVVAKNSDGDARLGRYLCVQRATPSNGLRSIRAAWVGGVGVSIGVNEAGVAYAGASLPSVARVDVGVPPLVIAADALDHATSAAEAAEIASRHPVTGHGYQELWVDASSAVRRVELLPGSVQQEVATAAWVAQTNWPMIEASLPYASATFAFRRNAEQRERTARVWGDKWDGTADAIADALRTHGEGGLCQHGDVDLYTVFSAIVDIGSRSLAITQGPPCAHPFERYELRAAAAE